MSRQQIAGILSMGPATVKFKKVDGSNGVMHCTIAPYLIPEDKKTSGSAELLAEYPINLSVLRVFDLDLNEWRSFRVDNVQEVVVGYGEESTQVNLLKE